MLLSIHKLLEYVVLLFIVVGCASLQPGVSANLPNLAATPAPVSSPKPLGEEQLAFCAYPGPDKHWAIYVSQADGQNSVRYDNQIWPDMDIGCWHFATGEYQVSGIVWSATGDRLFVVIGPFVGSHVIVLPITANLQISQAQILWKAELGFETPQEIVLSPDGDKLAFIGLASPLTGTPMLQYYELFVGKLDGTHFYPLTDIHQRIEPTFDPSWSPDGQWVALPKAPPHNGVGIAHSDGSGVKWLTEETVPEFPQAPDTLRSPISPVTPVWFRDSSHLFFLVALHGEVMSALYRVKPDGTELVKLRDSNTYSPALTPDGTRLAFVTYDDEGTRNSGAIVLTDLNAQNAKEIVRMEHPHNDKLLIRDLAWSADGTRLAFAANPNGNMDLFLVNADGSDLRDITGWPGDEIAPRWRPRP